MPSRKTVVTGVLEIDQKLAGLELKVQKNLARKPLREAGKLVHSRAIAILAAKKGVKTGRLKESIKVRAAKRSRSSFGIEILTKDLEEYASFVELGTKHSRSKKFLRPAGYESEPQIRKMVEQGVLQALGELAR